MTRSQQFSLLARTGRRVLKGFVTVSLVFLGVCCVLQNDMRAQDPAGQTGNNCSGLFTQPCNTSTSPQESADRSGQQVTTAPADSGRASQYRDESPNLIYTDQSGTYTRESDPYRDITHAVPFPPDPITDLQRLSQSATGELLPVFGRELFRNVPSTFAAGDQIAAPADYVIGPTDELLVRFWGPETFNSQLTVDRSGSIYIPKVGAIHVAGLRFDEVQKQVEDAVKRVYRNFNLTVNLGRLRSIQVYVVGEASRPGVYTVSSLSTVLNALFVSGGPNVRGSMRHIQVRRNGQVLPNLDLYDIVLRGDKSSDARLEPGDTIFIPPVGPQVALAGSVRHPALYELKTGNTLKDVLDLAGGFSATGAPSTLSLDRIDESNTRQTLTLPVNAADLAMPLRDGDVVFAEHIFAGYTKTVSIRGNLANPGRFAWHPGMRLSEIIPDRMALLTNDYWRQRNKLGVPSPLFEPLTRVQAAKLQQQLLSGSLTTAPADAKEKTYYERSSQSDTRDRSNGDRDSSTANASDSTSMQTLAESRTTSESARMIGQVGPAVSSVSASPDATANSGKGGDAEAREAAVQTAVGNVPINKIQIPAPQINWSYAVIERLNPNTLTNSLVPFNLGRLVQDHDVSQDLELQPGDIVTILSQQDIPVSLDAQVKYIRLEGEFVSPGVYSSKPGETLKELISRAGGFTPKAYLYGSSFLRESARVFQQQRLDEYLNQLSTDMNRALAVRAVSSATGALDPAVTVEQRSIIDQLRKLRATGRVVLAFNPGSAGVGDIPPLQLENGDVFRVPAAPATVSVLGAVYGQNVFLYEPKLRLNDYLSLAGNTNRVADKKAAFIIRADGSILSRDQAISTFSNHFDSARMYPGDAIVVPERLIRPTALRQLIDYSQILSSFGLAAAAINVVK